MHPNHRHPSLSKGLSSGFTLIELLVVVVIISISIGYVVVNISTNNEDEIAKEEILRLQQILRFAHEQSIIRAEEYGVRFYETGYRFMKFDEDNNVWRGLSRDKLLRNRTLPGDLELELYIEQVPVDILPSPKDDPVIKNEKSKALASAGSNIRTRSQFSTDTQQAKRIIPQVFLLSSSELTPPFEVRMRIPGTDVEAYLQGLPQGEYKQGKGDE